MSKKFIKICIFMLLTVLLWGQSNFSRGEEFFMQNNPSQAVVFLERALAEEPANSLIYLYLGVVYEQLNRNDEAIAIYRRILPSAGNLSANVANNLGNVISKEAIWMKPKVFIRRLLVLARCMPLHIWEGQILA